LPNFGAVVAVAFLAGGGAMKHRLLLIDNEQCTIDGIVAFLESCGFQVDFAPDPDHGIALVRQNPNRYSLIIVDFFMPTAEDGIYAIREIRKLNPFVCVMGLSGDNSVQTHNTSLDAGAESFFVKGDNLEKLYGIVRRFCDRHEDATRVVEIETPKDEKARLIESVGMVGVSTSMAQAATLIKKFGNTNETVLIRGENGVGKEGVAKAIHMNSLRKGKPFVAFNVNAIAATLFEAELFGSEKGSYTGSNRNKKGKFQLADGGTMFLDEIGDMPMDMQVKILRALQEKEVIPVGAEKPVKVDVRIVAATNVNLEAAVKAGRFREDLYYRLKVFPIEITPLRSRKEDIEPLVHHFKNEFNKERGTNVGFTGMTLKLLCNYDWYGNVRELESEVKLLMVVCEGPNVLPEHLDPKFHLAPANGLLEEYPDFEAQAKNSERTFFKRGLARGNSIRQGAALMKISKTTLLRKMKELGIEFDKEPVT